MTIKPFIYTLALGAGLVMAHAHANAPTASTTPAAAVTTHSAKASQKPTKRKAPRRYSKATLSAFKPLDPRAQPAPLTDAKLINPPATAQDQALKLKSDQDIGVTSSADVAIPPQDVEGSESSQNLLAEFSADSMELGQESVSVIDRVADKPKAQPIVSGPMRVRVQDKGVRATVQIPLAGN